MTVEINQNIELLQIKHDPTGKWAEAIILLQLQDGFLVRLTDNQLDAINQVTTSLQKLNVLTTQIKTISDGQPNNFKAIADQLQKLYVLGGDVKANDSNNYRILADKIEAIRLILANPATSPSDSDTSKLVSLLGQVEEALQENNDSTRHSLTQLETIALSNQQILQSSLGTNNVFEGVVEVRPGINTGIGLPEHTRTLVFSVRKDVDGLSHDLRYSVISGNLEAQMYRTLYAYNEFCKTNLDWSNKSLYLQSDTVVNVEIDVDF